MAKTLCSSTLISFNAAEKHGLITHSNAIRNVKWINENRHGSANTGFGALKVKATDDKTSAKTNSILCNDCEGNGAKVCTQCKGAGVNSVDHFNGQFKAGGLCWLCRGKKDILCGKCNGAGFLGGFMNAFDT